MRLFIGTNDGGCGAGQRIVLEGDRCMTIAHRYKGASCQYQSPHQLNILQDSGAFTHRTQKRWSFEQNLEQHYLWEKRFAKAQRFTTYHSFAWASYDLLLNEKWVSGQHRKRRWSENQTWCAVETTIAAAQYFHNNRSAIAPRKLIFGCQGVTPTQYLVCVREILRFATPGDWLGFGGWCVIGLQQFRHWLPVFHQTLELTIPEVATSKVKHIHLYGVLWEPALATFAWYCDRYGLTCSTDSKKPLTSCRGTPANRRKAGARKAHWQDNVAWWQQHVTHINRSQYYADPFKYHQLRLAI